MPGPVVYGMGDALMGEGEERFQTCGDVELENLLDFLLYCVARSLLFGESEEIRRRSVLKRMWDKRREKREKTEI